MCGIAGVIGDYQKYNFDDMMKSQIHRGPDAQHTFLDKGYGIFGHNRLAIIDIKKQSDQPFFDVSGRYVIVFNGEIYNYIELKSELILDYSFKTASDTEVLLAAYIKYGADCLSKLNGMFAFAIWDLKEKKLFAARDRFGVKPFFYTHLANTLIFSSEIKAIHKSGIDKKPNQDSWIRYFCEGSYGQPDDTFWDGIYQLAGGHYLEYEQDTLTIYKWYDFVSAVANQPKMTNYEEAVHHYKNLLLDSIHLRFRADVPVGFNVSGGLDSSALLALINASHPHPFNVEAFTFYTGSVDYDELPWVEQMMRHYQNPLHKVLLSADEVPTLSEKISYFQDEPFGGIPTLAYSKLFEKALSQGIKVILDGQGMDEQLAGYDYYTSSLSTTIQGVTKSPYRPQMLDASLLKIQKKNTYIQPFTEHIQNLQYRDLFYTKIPRALRFNDRVSMTYSIELREPFLDYRLVEFGFSLPLEYKIKFGEVKKILRDIIAGYLPETLVYAPKRPMQTPQREWLGNELKAYVNSHLEAIKNGEFSHWFSHEVITDEWKKYLKGDNESSFFIWQLVNFSLLTRMGN